MSEKTYGVILDPDLSLTPRMVEWESETTSLRQAMDFAINAILDGTAEEAQIVRTKYYGQDPNGYWGEDGNYGAIEINASSAERMIEE